LESRRTVGQPAAARISRRSPNSSIAELEVYDDG
jgi:hypothetical protein